MKLAARRGGALARLRRRVHVLLDGGSHDRLAQLTHDLLIALVAMSVTAVVLESVPELAKSYAPLFKAVEFVAVAVFTLEYLLRLWSAPEHTPYSEKPFWEARLAYVRSPSAIIDALSLAPFYLAFFVASDWRVLLLLRLLRFFKLARYSPGIRTLFAVLEAERKALLASALVLFGAMLFAAAAMHAAEHAAQPQAFGSIPAAMWWAMQTITTVGYGDVTPVTPIGRMIASVTMVVGFIMLGLPVGIVASAFAEEIHRREFVVTWSMVASVPLFRALDASAIAEIMRYLRAQSVPAGALISKRGDVAHSMYFIAAGSVEIALPDETVRLERGQFFGEGAVLRRSLRSGTSRALTPVKLLALDAEDLHMLMQRNPEMGAAVRGIAASRGDLAPRGMQGDILQAELSQGEDAQDQTDEGEA